MKRTLNVAIIVVMIFIAIPSLAQEHEEIVYGHKDGMALVMEKVKPAKPNGKAILFLMSGGYFSSNNWLANGLASSKQFLDHGYTVFLVFHGSKPKYNVLQVTGDITRAIKFVRYNAKKFGIDPDHIGMHGNSSGGHLTLYAATADDTSVKDSKDPVERVSSKLQAACVFYPPTDFLNFGEPGASIVINKNLAAERDVAASFDFRIWNDSLQAYDIPDANKQTEIVKHLSPLYNVSKDDAPVYIVHGDKDWVVPLQQSQVLVAAYKSAGVPYELVVKPGAEHGWKDENLDREKMVQWFDKYLK
ncbi:MAG: alpha/beta hydrolase [Bacteroidota bacterium]